MVAKNCHTGLKCLYTNACSLLNKMSELRHRADSCNADIIAITETWASDELTDAEFAIDGYTLFRKDRETGRFSKGGGVALFVKEALKPQLSSSMNISLFEDSVWCDVHVGEAMLLVGVCYRSTASTTVNDEKLCSLMEMAVNESRFKNAQLLIMGDFNFPEISYSDYDVRAPCNSSANKFFECTQDLFLCQHVDEFTRCRKNQLPSILDYVFTCDDDVIGSIQYETPLGKSDHCCVCFEYITQPFSVPSVNMSKLNFWRADYGSINEKLSHVDWDELFKDKTVEEMWSVFKTTLLELCLAHVPCRATAKPSVKNDWMSKSTLKWIKKRHAKWKRYRSVPSSRNYDAYKSARNKVTAAVRRDVNTFQQNLVKSFKGKPKRFYGYIRSKQVVKACVTNLRKADGSVTVSDDEVAETLNAQFQSVFVDEPPLDVEDQFVAGNCGQQIEIKFDVDTVKKKLINLKKDKSPGPDGIHPHLLCSTADMVARPLADIFTASFECGLVPADWRQANISPIFKKGSKDDPNNYRPVSLTSVPCKIMESIIRDAVVDYVERDDKISWQQHGFVKGRSCLTNLLEVLEAWTRILDEGYGIDVIYLDYRKAFDTVPHARLVSKLSQYGLGTQVCTWIRAFLSDRVMRVMVRGHASAWSSVLSGVPQGSVLGPLLFLLYVNDLPSCLTCSVRMFADDTKMWKLIAQNSDSYDLQQDLERLREWNDQWLLKFNPDKCHVMHIGHDVPTKYVMVQDGRSWNLSEVKEEKDLGVVVSCDLKVSKQCTTAVRKASNVLRLIRRHFSRLDRTTFLILYKGYVRPHLEYCIQAWSPSLRKDIVCIEQVQRRATKLVDGFKRLAYETRLKRLGLTTLEKRRIRGDLIETFKILTDREKVNKEDFFTLRKTEYNLRGHSFALELQRSRISIRSSFFSQRTVKHWNALPEHVVSADSVNSFKNRLDKCEDWGI